ncbi:MAG: hypothetical protein R3A52_09500 [Polyangiales bacterium]
MTRPPRARRAAPAPPTAAVTPAPPGQNPGALALLTALSGGATLAAEVMGARLLRPMLGSTALAQSGTVAGVLLGLGVGAAFTGRALARKRWSARDAIVRSHAALAALCLVAPFAATQLATPLARVLVAVSSPLPPSETSPAPSSDSW